MHCPEMFLGAELSNGYSMLDEFAEYKTSTREIKGGADLASIVVSKAEGLLGLAFGFSSSFFDCDM